jgi:2Fe-2S ferredoxin
MAKITYIDFEGTEREVEANAGDSVMETAINNGVPGIDADCGGACACATCHVFVDEAFLSKLPEQEETEEAMLEFTEGVQENSRLACQIIVTDELDGLRVTTPEQQG